MLYDDADNPINDVAAMQVSLKDPYEENVTLDPINSNDPLLLDVSGRFNGNNACWEYSTPIAVSYIYTKAHLSDPPSFGDYTLQVEIGGETVTNPIPFNYLLELPFIPSKTSQILTDPFGNIYWMWEVPQPILELSAEYDMSSRAVLSGYKDGQEIGYVFPFVPLHMGFCYFPFLSYQHLINQEADEFGFNLHVRLNNNFVRSYSNEIIVNDLTTLSITRKIGIEEAIYALQVVSGLR
jgi:hypothetical protein